MKASYNLYGPDGYIGFCIVQNQEYNIHANILLFETYAGDSRFTGGSYIEFEKDYPHGTGNTVILKELMALAVPMDKREPDALYTAKMNNEIIRV
jgi:hypothetical protein